MRSRIAQRCSKRIKTAAPYLTRMSGRAGLPFSRDPDQTTSEQEVPPSSAAELYECEYAGEAWDRQAGDQRNGNRHVRGNSRGRPRGQNRSQRGEGRQTNRQTNKSNVNEEYIAAIFAVKVWEAAKNGSCIFSVKNNAQRLQQMHGNGVL